MMQAIRCTVPAGMSATSASTTVCSCPGGVVLLPRAPARRPPPRCAFLSELIELTWNRQIDRGNVFDRELPLDPTADAYRAMDQWRAIKVLLHP
jgi:hypothetical protein